MKHNTFGILFMLIFATTALASTDESAVCQRSCELACAKFIKAKKIFADKVRIKDDLFVRGKIKTLKGIEPVTVTVGPNGKFATITDALNNFEPTCDEINVVLKLEEGLEHKIDFRILQRCLDNISKLELRGDERALVGSAYIQPSPFALFSDVTQGVEFFEGFYWPPEYGIGVTQITIIDPSTVKVEKVAFPLTPGQTVVQPDFSALVPGDKVTWVDQNGVLTDLQIQGIVGTTVTFTTPIPGAMAGLAPQGAGFAIQPNTKIIKGETAPIDGGGLALAGTSAIPFAGLEIFYKGLHILTNEEPPDSPTATTFNMTGESLLSNCMFGDATTFVRAQFAGSAASVGPIVFANARLRCVATSVLLLGSTFMGLEANLTSDVAARAVGAFSTYTGCRRAYHANNASQGNVDVSQFYNCVRSIEGRNGSSIAAILTAVFHDPSSVTFQDPDTIGVLLINNATLSDDCTPGIQDNISGVIPPGPPQACVRIGVIAGCGTAIKLLRNCSMTLSGYNPPFSPLNPPPLLDNVFAADIEGITFNDAQFFAAPMTVDVPGTNYGSSYIVKGVEP